MSNMSTEMRTKMLTQWNHNISKTFAFGLAKPTFVKGFYVRLPFVKSTYGFNKNIGYKDPFDPRNTLSLKVDVEWLHLSALEIKDLVVNVPATIVHTRPSAFSTVNLSEAPVEPSSF